MPSPDGAPIDEAGARELLVGPDSVCWRFASDVRLNLVMLYPLLLQVAHPTVAAGVRDFSQFENHPYERLARTVDYLNLLVYGGEDAIAAGRRLRELHKRFTGVREDGRRYSALEPEAYAWVHASLLHTYIVGHAQFGRPMHPAEIEQFYREYCGLGRLIGLSATDLPTTWTQFRGYFECVCNTELCPNDSVRRVLRAARTAGSPGPPLPAPVWSVVGFPARRAIWLGGVGPMTPELRRRLEISWGLRDELGFRALGQFTRALTPALPGRLRVAGPDQLRARCAAIERGPLGAGRGRGKPPPSGSFRPPGHGPAAARVLGCRPCSSVTPIRKPTRAPAPLYTRPP
jgi:uncharacterized protein (DUF2236 family)